MCTKFGDFRFKMNPGMLKFVTHLNVQSAHILTWQSSSEVLEQWGSYLIWNLFQNKLWTWER